MQRWAVLRKISDTVLVFQTLSWYDCYHFFLPICSLWNPWFLSHGEHFFRSKIEHSLFNPEFILVLSAQVSSSVYCLPGSPTTQQLCSDQVAKFRFRIQWPSPTQPGTWILNKKFHNGPFRSRAPWLEKAFSIADRMRRWQSAGNLALWLICQGSKHWFVICSSEVHPLASGNSDSSDLWPLAT